MSYRHNFAAHSGNENMEQRFMELPFTQNGNTLSIQGPPNANFEKEDEERFVEYEFGRRL